MCPPAKYSSNSPPPQTPSSSNRLSDRCSSPSLHLSPRWDHSYFCRLYLPLLQGEGEEERTRGGEGEGEGERKGGGRGERRGRGKGNGEGEGGDTTGYSRAAHRAASSPPRKLLQSSGARCVLSTLRKPVHPFTQHTMRHNFTPCVTTSRMSTFAKQLRECLLSQKISAPF